MKITSCLSCHSAILGLRFALKKTVAISALFGTLLAMPAFADESADVAKLLRAGQLEKAMEKADAFLAQRPREAQMRFLKGLILTEQKKVNEAISIFAKLTEDFPNLPEPYNNLAVLYASKGQFEKARVALDAAIRINPAYVTAYENLGDVHAKLASQAYGKVLQLESGNAAAKSKLASLGALAGNPSNNANTKMAVAPSPPVAAKAQPALVEQNAATAPVATAKPEAKPVSAPIENADRAAVLQVVDGWSKAWSAQDVKNYLSFYSNDFQPPNGESYKAWADERHARIAGKGRISVKIVSPQVTISDNTATVKFRQIYVSDRLTADNRKTLILSKQDEIWKIKQERTGN